MLPQEVELWYVIPALRKELALALKKYGLSQKKIAEILQVSPAAVSQYVKEKRAKDVPFDAETIAKIKDSATILTYNPKAFRQQIVHLTNEVRASKLICRIHELFDSKVTKGCNDCFLKEAQDE